MELLFVTAKRVAEKALKVRFPIMMRVFFSGALAMSNGQVTVTNPGRFGAARMQFNVT
jgi:hypothetical protein